ncbi:Hypothetical protein A7982_10040 [Minicystis rosea]|nr:Hypothetical protein A7982_10040 [Minicystis rosea]
MDEASRVAGPKRDVLDQPLAGDTSDAEHVATVRRATRDIATARRSARRLEALLALAVALLGCSAAKPAPSVPSATPSPALDAPAEGPRRTPSTFLSVFGLSVPGALGARWGDDAEATAARLGAPCRAWSPWRSATGFEVCENLDARVSVYGGQAHLRYYRRGPRLEGMAIRFVHARWPALRAAALADLPLSGAAADAGAPYEIFFDDSLVRVEPEPSDDGFTIVVAGPDFGKAYAAQLLGDGLGGLFRTR